MAKTKTIKGYICRSKNIGAVMICVGTNPPKQKKDGWFWYVPGWFFTLSIWKLKRMFGFSIRPGTYEPIDISISRTKLRQQLESLEKELKKWGEEMTGSKRRKKQKKANRRHNRVCNWSHCKK